MQKVEGSSPFIRFTRKPLGERLSAFWRCLAPLALEQLPVVSVNAGGVLPEFVPRRLDAGAHLHERGEVIVRVLFDPPWHGRKRLDESLEFEDGP